MLTPSMETCESQLALDGCVGSTDTQAFDSVNSCGYRVACICRFCCIPVSAGDRESVAVSQITGCRPSKAVVGAEVSGGSVAVDTVSSCSSRPLMSQ